MNSKVWFRKALSLCLIVALYATYSMVVLASPDKIVGQLTVSGKTVNGETPVVKVNGEVAQSGRAIFSSSTIVTSDSSTATFNLGKIGQLELAPNTTITVTFDDENLNADLLSGQVTALSADNVNVKIPTGETVKLKTGETAMATGQTQTTTQSAGDAWWIYALIAGAAITVVVLTATGDDDINVGGGTTVVSPNR